MSYAVKGLGEDLIVQWANGSQSAVASSTGPVCGYQIAAQVMLHDLGYGAGKPNMIDPGFNDAFHQYAVAHGIAHAAGSPVTNDMCARMLADWKAMAAPTAGNSRIWEVKPGAAPPPPQSCPPGYDWSAKTNGCQLNVPPPAAAAPVVPVAPVAPAPAPMIMSDGGPLPAAVVPDVAPVPSVVPSAGMSPVVKYALIGGAALLLITVVATKARKPASAAA